MRSDQVPTIASFMDFGGAAGFCSAAGGRCWAFWAWLETGSISANAAAIATTPSMLCRFIVFLPLLMRARRRMVTAVRYAQIPANFAASARLLSIPTGPPPVGGKSAAMAPLTSKPRRQVGEPLRGALDQ